MIYTLFLCIHLHPVYMLTPFLTVLTASSATRSAMPSKRPWTAIPRLSFLAIAILRSDVLSVIIDAHVVCCLAGCLSSAMMSSLQMIHLFLPNCDDFKIHSVSLRH